MGDTYTQLRDTIEGTEGKGYITIDGINRELFELSAITADIELTVKERRMLGSRMLQHKVTGAKGTGTMTVYFMTEEQLQMAKTYLTEGVYPAVTLQVYNDDRQSSIGRREVMLTNVIMNTIPVTRLDDQAEDPLTCETDFTFDGFDEISSFDTPENYR